MWLKLKSVYVRTILNKPNNKYARLGVVLLLAKRTMQFEHVRRSEIMRLR